MATKLELQEEKEYTIILTGAELVPVLNKMMELPYISIAQAVEKVTEQIQQQNKIQE